MREKKRIASRKCSALLAAGTGAVVCLTGGDVHAVSGSVSASNGTTIFSLNTASDNSMSFKLCSSKIVANFGLIATVGIGYLYQNVGSAKFHNAATAVLPLNSGVSVSAGLNFANTVGTLGATNKYFAFSFEDSGTKFGWVHVIDATDIGFLRIDTWAYNTLGNPIKTLSDSVTTSRLALTDGKEKLHWSNDNEDGVARYELQSQDASGAWQAAGSDVPGSGSYSAKVDSGKTCRLVVEMTDGSTKEIDF